MATFSASGVHAMSDHDKTIEQLIDELNEVRLEMAELKAAQKLLSEKESRYRDIVDKAGEAIFVIQGGRIKFVNQTATELTGYSKDEGLASQAIEAFVHPDDRDMVNQYHVRRLQGDNTPFRYDYRFLCRDGTVKWAEMNSSLIMWEGKPAGLCLVSDITERKQAEDALRESEIVHRTLCENIPGIVYRVLLSDPVTMNFFNPTVEPITGFTETELTMGDVCSIDPLILHEDKARVVDLVKQAIAEDKPFDVEYRIRHKSGSIRHLREYGRPMKSLAGERFYIDGVIFDDTERKLAAEALARSEETFRLIVEGAPEAVLVQTGGILAYVNAPALKLFGANSLSDLIGKPVMDRFHPSFHETIKERIRLLNVEKKQVMPLEEIWLRMDGSVINVDVSAVPINFRGQDGTLVFARDLTARKRIEQEKQALQAQLIQAQKMEALGTLVGGIAHDFNNMLQTIIGYSELLLINKKTGQPNYKDIETIIQTGKEGADLVKKLLAFGRQAPIFPIDLDLNHQIRELIPLISRTLPQVVQLDVDLTDEPATIHADPNQISQTVMNLAINASESMANGGHLKIETTNVWLDDEYCRTHHGVKPGNYLMLSISDTGCGMDEKTLARIFEPFFSTKQRGAAKGTGLGLSAVQGILEQQGAYITCESEPGIGSEFRIYFPTVLLEPTIQQKTSQSAQTAGTETILVVDDAPAIVELARRVLINAGYSVITATNGREALEIYRTRGREISLVILDLLMPEMSGKDCLMELVKIDPQVIVLVATGFSPGDDLHKEINPLVRGFVQKPYGMAELVNQARSVLDAKRERP